MRNFDLLCMEKFFAEKRDEIGQKNISIWGNTVLGKQIAEYMIVTGIPLYAILDSDASSQNVEIVCRKGFSDIGINSISLYNPNNYSLSDNDFIVIAAKTMFPEIEARLEASGIGYASYFPWFLQKTTSDPELTLIKYREMQNLVGVLYSFQEYQSDLIVDGVYRNALVVTTSIGCPVHCKYCPQDEFIKAYNRRPNPVKILRMEDYVRILAKIPTDIIVSFTGMTEPFSNPECLDMILYTMEKGHKVRVFSTMYNQSIDSYKAFKDHSNLKTFDLHIPDTYGNTTFPITEKYLKLIQYIVSNKPKYGRFWTSCLGLGGGPKEELRDIINVPGNPINSIHGLVYDNHLHHGDAKLSCKYDCSRIDNPAAGIGMLFPNGDVTGCTQDWELLHVIGNIYEVESWSQLMGSEKRKYFQQSLTDASIPSICRICELAVKLDASDIN